MINIHGLFTKTSKDSFEHAWRFIGHAPTPSAKQVLVRVHASAVNPIDTKRANGYGARVLRLKQAAGLPRILGNDFAGHVELAGKLVTKYPEGSRVWGLLDTGPQGAHASHVLVSEDQLLVAPKGMPYASLAALPYTFCTVWAALQGIKLNHETAQGKRVLIHGASGGLGTLALQLLRYWGATTTAVCSPNKVATCLNAGANETFDRSVRSLDELPENFDAALNFASWNDEHVLARKINSNALGMSTTTHPLLTNFDQFGWVRGGVRNRMDYLSVKDLVHQRSATASYRWTIFRPNTNALRSLQTLVGIGVCDLPIGIQVPMTNPESAFCHIADGRAGRAILVSST